MVWLRKTKGFNVFYLVQTYIYGVTRNFYFLSVQNVSIDLLSCTEMSIFKAKESCSRADWHGGSNWKIVAAVPSF